MQHFISFFLKFQSNFLVKTVFYLFNATFGTTILYLISRVHLASFVISGISHILQLFLTYHIQ